MTVKELAELLKALNQDSDILYFDREYGESVDIDEIEDYIDYYVIK